MRIKNEEIKVNIGNKQYIFHNLILDAYLKKFMNYQIANIEDSRGMAYNRELDYVLLKFDTTLEYNEQSEIHNTDFDICLIYDAKKRTQIISKNVIVIDYIYKNEEANIIVVDYSTGNSSVLANYIGKKITAVGFNTHFIPTNPSILPVCSIIDTSNYNLYITDGQTLSFARKDYISSDAEFYTEIPSIEGAYHLAPKIILNDNAESGTLATKLVAFGFTNKKNEIQDRYSVDDNYSIEGTSMIFNNIQNTKSETIYANESILASSSLKAQRETFKYISFEYDSYIYANENYKYQGKYFMIIPVVKYGNTVLKISYERG